MLLKQAPISKNPFKPTFTDVLTSWCLKLVLTVLKTSFDKNKSYEVLHRDYKKI